MVTCLQDTDQFAVIRIIFVRAKHIDIRFRSLAVYIGVEVQITLVVMAFQLCQDATFIGDHLVFPEIRLDDGSIVAGYAVAVQYRLHFQAEGERADASFGHFQFMREDSGGDCAFRHGNRVLIFMATRTGDNLAGHTGQPASHPLDSGPVFIQWLDRDRRVGRYLEHDGTVFFNRDGTENTFNIPSALNTLCIMVGRSEDIGIFVGEDAERFDCSPRDALCAFTFIDVLYKYGSLFLSRFDFRRDDRRCFRFFQWDGGGEAFAFLLGDQGKVVEYIHQIDSPKCVGTGFAGHQEIFFIQRIRLHELRPYTFHQFVFDDRDDRAFAER